MSEESLTGKQTDEEPSAEKQEPVALKTEARIWEQIKGKILRSESGELCGVSGRSEGGKAEGNWRDADRVSETAWADLRFPEDSRLRQWKKQGEYTVEDYRTWPEDERVELIDGFIIRMEAPTGVHQEILAELTAEFVNFVRSRHGECRVFPAAFDVQLDRDDRTMVQPDISVICSRDRLRPWGCYGAPDLVVEILSQSTARRDLMVKLQKYADAGVQEYWIVDPRETKILVYRDLPDHLIPFCYSFEDKVPVGIWADECLVDFVEISRWMWSVDEEQ